jgi:predicted transcriptional regulator
MRTLTIQIEDGLYDLLQAVAQDQETTTEEIIRRALDIYLRVWAPPGHEPHD